jgi:hypothetical protein
MVYRALSRVCTRRNARRLLPPPCRQHRAVAFLNYNFSVDCWWFTAANRYDFLTVGTGTSSYFPRWRLGHVSYHQCPVRSVLSVVTSQSGTPSHICPSVPFIPLVRGSASIAVIRCKPEPGWNETTSCCYGHIRLLPVCDVMPASIKLQLHAWVHIIQSARCLFSAWHSLCMDLLCLT